MSDRARIARPAARYARGSGPCVEPSVLVRPGTASAASGRPDDCTPAGTHRPLNPTPSPQHRRLNARPGTASAASGRPDECARVNEPCARRQRRLPADCHCVNLLAPFNPEPDPAPRQRTRSLDRAASVSRSIARSHPSPTDSVPRANSRLPAWCTWLAPSARSWRVEVQCRRHRRHARGSSERSVRGVTTHAPRRSRQSPVARQHGVPDRERRESRRAAVLQRRDVADYTGHAAFHMCCFPDRQILGHLRVARFRMCGK